MNDNQWVSFNLGLFACVFLPFSVLFHFKKSVIHSLPLLTALQSTESNEMIGKSAAVSPDQFGLWLFTEIFHTPGRDLCLRAHFKCICFHVKKTKATVPWVKEAGDCNVYLWEAIHWERLTGLTVICFTRTEVVKQLHGRQGNKCGWYSLWALKIMEFLSVFITLSVQHCMETWASVLRLAN